MDSYDRGIAYWIWLSENNGIGPVSAKALLDKFITPQNINIGTSRKKSIVKTCRKIYLENLHINNNIAPFSGRNYKRVVFE